MFTSLTIIPDSFEEVPARSSMPWVWFGFLFVAAFIIEETLMVMLELDQSVAKLVLVMVGISGWIYWFFCVSRFHQILRELSRDRYPISNLEAVGKHFIPFYNLVWVFRWPAEMSEYLNQRGRVKMVSGNLLGLFLLLSAFTSRFLDGGVGLTGVFAVGMYISAKLGRHMDLVKGVSKEMLPPPPDADLFQSVPLRSPAIEANK
jgi:hypothetical protein